MSEQSSYYISTLVGMRFDLAKEAYDARVPRHKSKSMRKKLSAIASARNLKLSINELNWLRFKFGKPEHALSKSELVEKGHFEERLAKLSPSELVRYEAASEDETVKNLVEAHRFRALTPELRAAYFGEPPDYVHPGVRMDCWKMRRGHLVDDRG